MPITTLQANDFLDSLPDPMYVQIHSGDPGAAGTTNAIAADRQIAAYDAASSKSRVLSDPVAITDCPEADVKAFSLWDDDVAGNCLWTGWLSGSPKAFTGEESAEDIACPNHGFIADDQVVFYDDGVGTLPTGISEATLYHVISAGIGTHAFRVSATQGGSAVNITAKGQGLVAKVTPKTIANDGDTFNLTAATLSIA